jgi:hypothetical protein
LKLATFPADFGTNLILRPAPLLLGVISTLEDVDLGDGEKQGIFFVRTTLDVIDLGDGETQGLFFSFILGVEDGVATTWNGLISPVFLLSVSSTINGSITRLLWLEIEFAQLLLCILNGESPSFVPSSFSQSTDPKLITLSPKSLGLMTFGVSFCGEGVVAASLLLLLEDDLFLDFNRSLLEDLDLDFVLFPLSDPVVVFCRPWLELNGSFFVCDRG